MADPPKRSQITLHSEASEVDRVHSTLVGGHGNHLRSNGISADGGEGCNPYVIDGKPTLLSQVEKAMTLLAFDDLSQCPVNDLVENQQRLKVSSELNTTLLRQQHNA